MQLVSETANWRSDVGGVIPEFFDDSHLGHRERAQHQRPATWKTRPRCSCSGKRRRANLFGPGVDPVGEQVRIANVPFTVDRAARAQGPVAARLRPRRQRLCAVHHLRDEAPGRVAQRGQRAELRQRHLRRRCRRRRTADHGASARAPSHRAGHGRRLPGSQHGRSGRGGGGGRAHHGDAARRRSRRCRCSSAASAS